MRNKTAGLWEYVEPYRLGSGQRNHGWRFGLLMEPPSERDDGQWYTAFLFRNKERTVFGLREWLGLPLPHHRDLRQMATRVVKDEAFRKALLTGDPDVEETWKKR